MKSEQAYNLMRYGQDLKKPFYLDYVAFEKLCRLRRMCLKHNRLCVDYCNEANFNPTLIDEQEAKIKALVDDLPIGANIEIEEIQRDPRGCTINFKNYFFSSFIWG